MSLGHQHVHRWYSPDFRYPVAFGGNMGHRCVNPGCGMNYGPRTMNYGPWPLAAAWAWIAPRPQLASRPPTSIWSSPGLLFQFCLFPEHMNHSASFSPPFLHPITMAPTTLVPCGARRAYVSAQTVRTQAGPVGVLDPPGPSGTM